MKYPIAYVLSKKFSDRKWYIRENDINSLEINDGADLITQEQLESADAQLAAEELSTQYQRDRASAYPSTADQLDLLWHAMDAGTMPMVHDFYHALLAVKNKFPKPEITNAAS